MTASPLAYESPAARPATPFLDQLQLRHGPVAQLGRFFLLADQAVRDLGLYLQLHHDMQSLAEVYPHVLPGRTLPVLPIFHPDHSDLSADTAFWISGHDETGRVVATQAARLFDMTHTTVAEEFRSLRMYFRDPAPHQAAGMRCEVDCPPAEELSGRLVYSGGAIYHTKVRGKGLSRILPRISRALAYSMWNTEHTFGLVEKVLVEKNVHISYGYTNVSPEIRMLGSNRGDVYFDMVWMDPQEMLADLATYASSMATGNEVRNTEATDTNWVPLRRQGSSSRS
jgi:hypothetical protein